MNTSESIYKDKKPKAKLPEPIAAPAVKPVLLKARWPKDSLEDIQSIFGKLNDWDYNQDGTPTDSWESSNLSKLDLPYPMRMSWNVKGELIRHIRCNNAVFQSLATVLNGIWELYGKNLSKIQEARMDLYGGCYNFRPRRGGHALSLHSWGAAIDIDPENNPQGKKWEADKGMMPKDVISLFMNEGWKWGGTFSNPDGMHFEATS